jgi:hypothetical protein
VTGTPEQIADTLQEWFEAGVDGFNLVYSVTPGTFVDLGIRLTRDSWVSVMYAEDLNSAKSSVTFQGTDRHDILGQQSADFQVSL